MRSSRLAAIGKSEYCARFSSSSLSRSSSPHHQSKYYSRQNSISTSHLIRNIHRIVANIGEHSQHCIDIHVDKTKRAGGSPGVSCCLSYVASTGNCTMQKRFLEEDLSYFRCVLKNQKYNLFDFFFKKLEILKSGIGLPSFL